MEYIVHLIFVACDCKYNDRCRVLFPCVTGKRCYFAVNRLVLCYLSMRFLVSCVLDLPLVAALQYSSTVDL